MRRLDDDTAVLFEPSPSEVEAAGLRRVLSSFLFDKICVLLIN